VATLTQPVSGLTVSSGILFTRTSHGMVHAWGGDAAMMAVSVLAIAAPAAVLGAASMGLASAAQARATKEVTQTQTLDPALLLSLLHRPLWLVGVLATIGGLVLQLVALAFGPLVLVQPVLITSLLFASGFASWMGRRRVDPRTLLGASLCSAGLAAFLLLAHPTGGRQAPLGAAALAPLAILFGALLIGCVLVAVRVTQRVRVLFLALATGLAYGMTAALMKVVTGALRLGFGALFGHPALYLACVLGPIGFLLSQNTFQQGKLMPPALAVITTVDPLVGVVLGIAWFDERVSTSAAVLAGQALAGAVVIGGIALLSTRAASLTVVQADPEAGAAWPADAGGGGAPSTASGC
ncbi:MAG: DMT family transporter, partial [Sciscionella sp.]